MPVPVTVPLIPSVAVLEAMDEATLDASDEMEEAMEEAMEDAVAAGPLGREGVSEAFLKGAKGFVGWILRG